MRLLRTIMVFSLIIVIPILIICLSANVALRAPDVYQYSLKSTEILDEQNIDAEEDIVGELFSDFLLHKIPEFQMTPGIESEDEFIFTKNDQLAMKSLRTVLDITAAVAAVFLLITIISYIFLIRTNYKEALRWLFKRVIIVMALFAIVLIVLRFLPFTSTFVHDYIFKTAFSEIDMIPMIMGKTYTNCLLVVSEAICIILTSVSAYITWALTKPKRMFF